MLGKFEVKSVKYVRKHTLILANDMMNLNIITNNNKNQSNKQHLEFSGISVRREKQVSLAINNCDNPNYFTEVVAPSIREKLPIQNSIAGKTINYLTNTYDLLDHTSADLCAGGLKPQTGREVVEFVSRSSASLIAIGTGIKLTMLGSLIGFGGAVAGAATGVGLLIVLPYVAAKGSGDLIDFGASLLQKSKNYLKSRF